MRYFRSVLISFVAPVLLSTLVSGQDTNAAPVGSLAQASTPVSLDQVVAKVIDREHFYVSASELASDRRNLHSEPQR